MIDPTKLRDLIQQIGDLGPIPEGLSAHRVVIDSPIGPVKVRAYATEAEAWRQQRMLDKLKGAIFYPELLGRVDCYLVFRYLDISPAGDVQDPAVVPAIGKFLGILNATAIDYTGQARLDTEFIDWLGRLSAMGIVPARVAEKARAAYATLRPPGLSIRLDYWDAMPHNFGWADGDLYLLDEKHLRPSFPGVGLIKPMLLLPAADWQRLRLGYASAGSLEDFDRLRPFLEFYYIVAALYFYSLVGDAGRVTLAKNPRFLEYRDRLIQTVSAPRSTDWLRAEVHLYRTFPQQAPALFARRLRVLFAGLRKRI